MQTYDFESIETRKKLNQLVLSGRVSKTIKHELKVNDNFAKAEILFVDLRKILDEIKKAKIEYSDEDITSFHIAVSTLVRYAPSAEDSHCYFNLVLSEFDKPLRAPMLELTLLNNLIHVHIGHKDTDSALSIIEVALEIGVFQLQVDKKYKYIPGSFVNPLVLFESLLHQVLIHHGVEFNENKTGITKYIGK
ncbi:hypothetical protein HPULCUR_000269 [Helicostylum pulchrum]|uniref:Uncharacterized protein n=1 Tax=Helicostylum pulchrum TaxID=562976 RepID=A0ABP9XJH2_9FUNG